MNIDPMASKYYPFSTYHYSANNPIYFKDVDGRYFVGTNGKRVRIRRRRDGTLRLGRNASSDLRSLVNSINSSGSKTAVAQILKTGKNKSRVHVKIENEVHDTPGQLGYGLLGAHRAHDADGNVLVWNSEKGDFVGTPAYVEGEDGVYKEATITIFAANIGKHESTLKEFFDRTVEQETARVFQHETHHNTDKEFIQDLKNKREGRENKGIGPHDNVIPQDEKVIQEILNKINKDRPLPGSAGQAGKNN